MECEMIDCTTPSSMIDGNIRGSATFFACLLENIAVTGYMGYVVHRYLSWGLTTSITKGLVLLQNEMDSNFRQKIMGFSFRNVAAQFSPLSRPLQILS